MRIVPEGSGVANYAFDVTPARLVTGLITERGVVAPNREALGQGFQGARGCGRISAYRLCRVLGVLRASAASRASHAGQVPLPGILHSMSFSSLAASLPVDGRQSATALAVARGTTRLLHSLGYSVVSELSLPSGRRADLVALGAAARS